MTTGYFETELKKGESIIFSASLDEMGSTKTIEEVFAASIARRTHKIDFLSCLEHSARQFVIRRPGGRTEVIAGYPWHGVSGRQSFVALPGITLLQEHKEDCIDVLDTEVRKMRDGMSAGSGLGGRRGRRPAVVFWTLQRLGGTIGDEAVWNRYGGAMKEVLEATAGDRRRRVALHGNGLVWASSDEIPLTWMNSMIGGRPVTPRNGYQVEVNALWYNAVRYTLELARSQGERTSLRQGVGGSLPARTRGRRSGELFAPAGGLSGRLRGRAAGPDKSDRART